MLFKQSLTERKINCSQAIIHLIERAWRIILPKRKEGGTIYISIPAGHLSKATVVSCCTGLESDTNTGIVLKWWRVSMPACNT
jgi:hypothetical protein